MHKKEREEETEISSQWRLRPAVSGVATALNPLRVVATSYSKALFFARSVCSHPGKSFHPFSSIDSWRATSRLHSSRFMRRRAWAKEKTRKSLRRIKETQRVRMEKENWQRKKRRILVRAPTRSYVSSGNVRGVPAGRITKLISRPLNSTSNRKIHPSGRMLLFACDFPGCYQANRALPTASSGQFIALPYRRNIFLHSFLSCKIRQYYIKYIPLFSTAKCL